MEQETVLFDGGCLTLMPDEVLTLFGHGGFRPPELPEEPDIDWIGLKPTLLGIEKTKNRNNSATLRRSGLSIADPEGVVSVPDESQRELPKALAVLAQRALAREKYLANLYPGSDRIGAIAVRQALAESLSALAENPEALVTEVHCPEHSEVEED